MNDVVVLDASALLCLLKDEPGGARVIEALPNAIVSAVNLAEVFAKLSEVGGSEKKIAQALRVLHLKIEPFDAEQARMAGMLLVATKAFGLSLGDRACLGLSRLRQAPALTTDKAWANLPQHLGLSVIVVR